MKISVINYTNKRYTVRIIIIEIPTTYIKSAEKNEPFLKFDPFGKVDTKYLIVK